MAHLQLPGSLAHGFYCPCMNLLYVVTTVRIKLLKEDFKITYDY